MIRPGSVSWKRVIKDFKPMREKFQKLGNMTIVNDLVILDDLDNSISSTIIIYMSICSN